MATVTRASDALPTLTSKIISAALTDSFNNIFNFLEANNIDDANVDYTSTDGIMALRRAQVVTGVKSYENTAAAAGGIREVAEFGIDPATGTATDADGGRITFYADDDGGAETDIARFDWVFTDTANASEDARIDIYAIVAGTIGTVLELGYDTSGNIVNVIQTREAIAAAVRDALILEWDPDGDGNGTDDSTGVALAFRMPDDADAQDIFARITALMSDDAAGTEDCTLRFGVITAGTLANEVQLTGAAFSPVTNNGNALGTTTLGWADLFLATGGVINWNNGEVTITETDADTLTIAGVATRLDLAAGILELNNAVEWDTGVAVVAGEYSVGRDADGTNQLHFNVPTGATFEWSVNDVSKAVLTTGPILFLNDTANTVQTVGITIDQGTADDEILSFKSSDVAHGMTSADGSETDTFLAIKKAVAASGGAALLGMSAATLALGMNAYGTTDDTTKSTAGIGYFLVNAGKKLDGGVGAPGANANIAVFRTGGTTTHILDSDGDSHQDVGTAWTNFDDYDDATMINALAVHVSRPDDPIRERFREFLHFSRDALQEAKLVTFNDDGHHFVNMSKLAMLHTGAIRQMHQRLENIERKMIEEKN